MMMAWTRGGRDEKHADSRYNLAVDLKRLAKRLDEG